MPIVLPVISLEVHINEAQTVTERVVETVQVPKVAEDDPMFKEIDKILDKLNMTDVSKEPFENHYVIQKELGRGKFATVYQCQKHTTSDLFAAKIVQTRSPKHVEEALTEVEILRACDHPCIVKVWDVFQSKNSLTIVLELIGGGELFEKLANEDTVSEGQAASYTKQVLDAMAHLHSLKIAHLDLKPENLMLSAKNSDIIKVVDFGLAKRMNKRVVCMQGTPEFVPPEVIALDPLSTYSDMWSVGVIVYIMVSGYSPFMGDDDNETYGNIAMCDYEFYEDEFAKISDECKDFIKSLLVMKPTDRMSATDALRHVWITSRDDNDTRIENQKIKRFLAQRKWKAIKKAFEATNKFNSLLSNMKRAAAEPGYEFDPADFPPGFDPLNFDPSDFDGEVPNANSINITQAIVPSVNMDHRKLVVTEGDNISITAHVVSKPTCSWTKDGTALVVDKAKFNVIQSDCQSILVISKFTRQDEGSYTIACSNAAGTTTATIQLITLGPTAPSVTIDKTEFIGVAGESVIIHADMVADPKPTIGWEKNGKSCKGERFVTNIQNCEVTLEIKRLKETDAGSYTLKAKNNLGKGAATVCLRVKKPEAPNTNSPSQKSEKKLPVLKVVDKKPGKAEPKQPQTVPAVVTPAAANANEVKKPEAEPVTKPVEPIKEAELLKPVEDKPPVVVAEKPVEPEPKLEEVPKEDVESEIAVSKVPEQRESVEEAPEEAAKPAENGDITVTPADPDCESKREASPSSSSEPGRLEKSKSVDENMQKEVAECGAKGKRLSMAAMTTTKMKLITKKNDECAIM